MNTTLDMQLPRGPLAGVREIIRFNRPQYAAAAATLAAGAMVLALIDCSAQIRGLLIVGMALAAWWALASLVASYWVYDASGLMRWTWLRGLLDVSPVAWANLHAGLDESSAALAAMFPGSNGVVLDIYDPAEMTEPSIARARAEARPAPPAQRCRAGALPLPGGSVDAVFLLFCAHELRRRSSRGALFKEVRRVLTPGGSLVVVEHLRDAANFAAFGPGFLHFLSRRAWHRDPRAAGLVLVDERRFTPFVRTFVWRRPS